LPPAFCIPGTPLKRNGHTSTLVSRKESPGRKDRCPMVLYEVLNPTVPHNNLSLSLAQGVDSLSGKTLGILSNQKVNADAVLDALVSKIKSRFEIAKVVKRVKQIQSKPAEAHILDDLVRDCDFVIHGVGD